MLRQILNPDLYHGYKPGKSFFEGWYFKLACISGEIFAFIPGIISTPNNECYSFIQVLQGDIPTLDFLKYPCDAFSAHKDKFKVKIAANEFSLQGIKLDILDMRVKVKADIKFINIHKWPDNILNPGSMGFYNYLPSMECYSQVSVMDGEAAGYIQYNNKIINLNGAKLYIEKNWGSGFPFSYIWAQGNSFSNPKLSLSCSIGKVPLFSKSFTGFLIGLLAEDKFFKFTTINKSKLHILTDSTGIRFVTENKNHQLHINCSYSNDKFVMLYAPKNSSMIPCAEENISGSISITLIDKKSNTTLLEDTSKMAGIEFCGDYKNLYKEL